MHRSRLSPLVIDCADAEFERSVDFWSGALGKEVWVLLPAKTDWRWSRRRDGSLWYPGLTMHRQDSGEDWVTVLERAGAALDDWQRRRG